MITKLSHVMMWAQDLERVKKWYAEKFGFTVNYYAVGEFLSLSSSEMGRLDFHATGPDTSNIGKGPMPYFVVKDLAAVVIWLEKKGIKACDLQQEADSPKHCWFADCEGNQIGLEEF